MIHQLQYSSTQVCVCMQTSQWLINGVHSSQLDLLLLSEKGVCGRVFIFAFNGTISQRIHVCRRLFITSLFVTTSKYCVPSNTAAQQILLLLMVTISQTAKQSNRTTVHIPTIPHAAYQLTDTRLEVRQSDHSAKTRL